MIGFFPQRELFEVIFFTEMESVVGPKYDDRFISPWTIVESIQDAADLSICEANFFLNNSGDCEKSDVEGD